MGLKASGLLFYAERIYSTLVGFLFVLLVTRNLSPVEFGSWSVISSILTYACLATFTNYWVTRLRARGVVEATTSGLVLSVIFAGVASLALLFLKPLLSRELHVPESALFIALFYVPAIYINSTVYASLYALSPSRAAVSEFVFETGKMLAAVLLWLTWSITLETALLAVLAGHASQALYLLASARKDFASRPSRSVVRKVASLSVFNLATQPASLVAGLDVPIISLLTGNLAVAYYTVVNTFSGLVGYSYVLARGLYPSMLRTDDSGVHRRSVEESLRLLLLLGVPMLAGTVFVAPNLLYLFRPEYTCAADVLRVASASALLGSVGGVLGDALQGAERADVEGRSLREIANSKIFRVFMLGYVRLAVGFPLLLVAVLRETDPLKVAFYAKLAWLTGDTAVLVLLSYWARHLANYRDIASSTVRYLVGALPAATVAWLVNPLKIREALLAVILAGAIYFSILYVIDSWFRRQVAVLISRLSALKSRNKRRERSFAVRC